jgi:transposase
MKMPLEMEMEKKRNEIIAYAVRHLPIIKEFAMKLGIVEIINELVPSQMDEDPGTVFLAMILDTLSGRTPLYRLDEFFENQDTELLLGKNVKPEAFKDYSVARVLDKAYEVGSIKIFTEISRRAVLAFDIDTSHVSFDTTSISVHGEYEQCSDAATADAPFLIVHGYSKDHRPDLKQFLISLLCVDKSIPIIGKTEDGNASDKSINNTVLSSISRHLAKFGIAEGAYIYIADSAMVTEENLKRTGDSILFISRLPATYNECGRVIKEAVEKDQWEDIGVLAETKPTKNRPATHYKARESEVELHGKKYRALVVHSSAHDKRRKKKIDRELEADRKAVESKLEKLSKQTFFCFKDAERAMKELLAEKSKYHSVEANVEETKKYKRGRPANGERKVDRILFSVVGRVEEKPKAVENFKKEAGCFVLLTNVPKEGKMARSSLELLKAYKDQHGIEQNFGFLKDPVIVNSIFLKKPERIEVLGLVLLLSLLIWRLLERAMRNYAEKTGEDLPGWKNRRTRKPTSFMLGTKFAGVIVLKIGGERILSKPLTSQQKEYLHSLGIRSDVFTNPKLE